MIDQEFSPIISRQPNHSSLLSCKHCLILFNLSLGLSSLAEILSSGLALLIHSVVLVSFLSTRNTSFSLTGQLSLPYSILLCIYAEYNLPFAPIGKHLLANKGTKSLNLVHLLLILVVSLSTAPSLAPFV